MWWTCDTTTTSLSCAFQVDVTTSAAAGDTIANVSGSSTVAVSTLAPHEVLATSSTSADVAGIRFDTAPGATITLDAKVNGQDSGSFLFFVQDDKVNGGYQGTLTDPLMLQPSAP